MNRREMGQVFEGVKDCTSAAMQQALDDWFELYFQDQPT